MTPSLLNGPAVEPVSLADMKGFLRLDGDEEDELVASMITAARLMVEATAGRLLIAQTWRLTLDAWPREGVLRVPLGPLAGLVGARVAAAGGGFTSLPLTSFVVDMLADPGRIVAVAQLPNPARAVGGIELDVTMGYGPKPDDVPMPLRQAIRGLAARWFEDRGDAAGRPEEVVAAAGVTALIAPYRRMRL